MIGLDPVVRLAPGSLTAPAIDVLLLEFSDRGRVAVETVPGEDA
jgi:hypothetical protein